MSCCRCVQLHEQTTARQRAKHFRQQRTGRGLPLDAADEASAHSRFAIVEWSMCVCNAAREQSDVWVLVLCGSGKNCDFQIGVSALGNCDGGRY